MTAPAQFYCPTQRDVRQTAEGKCPHCGMELIREGSRFGIVRHTLSNRLHIAVTVVLMVVVMALVMMMKR